MLKNLSKYEGKVFDGIWCESSGGTAEVAEKATGASLTVVGIADHTDVRVAANSAKNAQSSWAKVPPDERAKVMRTAAQLLIDSRDDTLEWLVREGDGTRSKATAEIEASARELWAAAELPNRPYGALLPSTPERNSVGRRVPRGVVGVISPWNMPLLLGMRAIAPALALGNTVVLKPDMQTPVSGGLVPARLLEQAGLPPGALHVLPGDAGPGAALTEDPDVAMICFTGSSSTGRIVGETAGRLLKKTSLELGGNSAVIVLEDADLDLAASAGSWGYFLHQGQICMATSRHIVLDTVADEYARRLAEHAKQLRVGDPWVEDVELGPLINAEQLRRVHEIVTETVKAGAELRTGGNSTGLYYRPTVLTGVTPETPAFAEEIFGPVAPVIRAANEDEAVTLANQTEYGLSAAVQTGDPRRGLRLAERLDTGLVHINDQTVNDDPYAPFGGQKASGNGTRYGAEQSWEEFTTWIWFTVRETPTPFPF